MAYPRIGDMSSSLAPQSGMGPARVTRSAQLQRKLEQAGLPEGSANWFIHAVDPMRDDDVIPACGYPDADRSSTVVSDILTEFTITVNGTGPQDLHIATTGILANLGPTTNPPFLTTTLSQSRIDETYGPSIINFPSSVSTLATWPANLLIWTQGPTGNQTFPPTSIPGTAVTGGLDPSSGFLNAGFGNQAARLVGFGFEAINTTPALTRGGSVICYKQAAPLDVDILNANASIVGVPSVNILGALPFTVLASQAPPGTAAAARLLHGSTEWAAEQGAYIVLNQSDVANPLLASRSMPVALTNTTSSVANALTTALGYTDSAVAVSTNTFGILPTVDENYVVPYEQAGMYFTGLPSGSTIVLRARAKIELAVESSAGLLATLSRPSTAYDARAIALLSHVMHDAPVAVPFGDNPAGEWLSRIAMIAGFAAPVISGLFPGSGPFVQAGVAFLGNQANRMKEREAAKMKQLTSVDRATAEKMIAADLAADKKGMAKAKALVANAKAAASSKSKRK